MRRVLEGVIAAEWKGGSEAGEKDVCLLQLIKSSFLFLKAKSPFCPFCIAPTSLFMDLLSFPSRSDFKVSLLLSLLMHVDCTY